MSSVNSNDYYINSDVEIVFYIITPGGYIIKQDFSDCPKTIRDIFSEFTDGLTTRMILEKAVKAMSQITKCDCTVTRTENVTYRKQNKG